MVFSVLGADSTVVGFFVRLVASGVNSADLCPPGAIPDAWRFDYAGCQNIIALTSESTAGGPDCPSLSTQSPLFASFAGYDPDLMQMRFLVSASFLRFDPDPAQRYTLGRLVFDMSAAVEGVAGSPGYCGGAEQPLCFLVDYAELTYEDRFPEGSPLFPENDGIGWQGAACLCPQVRSSSWGRVKGLYR